DRRDEYQHRGTNGFTFANEHADRCEQHQDCRERGDAENPFQSSALIAEFERHRVASRSGTEPAAGENTTETSMNAPRSVLAILALLAAYAWSPTLFAQAYPNKPVRV